MFFIPLLGEIADYSHGLFLWIIHLFQKVFSRMKVRAYPSSALIVSMISAKDSLICDWLTVFVDVPLRGSGIYKGSHTSCLKLPLAYGESIAISLIYHCFIIAICLQCMSAFNIHVSAHWEKKTLFSTNTSNKDFILSRVSSQIKLTQSLKRCETKGWCR